MPEELCLPPSAAALSGSMRDIGYSLETAIADLIDNSISADATEVDVRFETNDGHEPAILIIDNGHGMNRDSLIAAMRHGSANPKDKRQASDLGRFGLGLKTSSFSQCRQLTVISRKNGTTTALQWDLDLVDQRDEWIVYILDAHELPEMPLGNLPPTQGTMVIWRKLDRILEGLTGLCKDQLINARIDQLDHHLSLVFHRFLSGSAERRLGLRIRINGHELQPFDPFCLTNKATQIQPEERIKVDGHIVTIQPYILPHHSKLTPSEYRFYQTRSDFIANQGAYVYRNGRLMAWGDWFRLTPKSEDTKLARVRIDFPNALDEAWTIDIKKSRAQPPQPVRERMIQILEQITGRSRQVSKGRGSRLFNADRHPVWNRFADQGRIRYSIDRNHPLVQAINSRLSEWDIRAIEVLLDAIAGSLPLDAIYMDYAATPKDIDQSPPDVDQEVVRNRLRTILQLVPEKLGANMNDRLRAVLSTGLFRGHEDLVESLMAICQDTKP